MGGSWTTQGTGEAKRGSVASPNYPRVRRAQFAIRLRAESRGDDDAESETNARRIAMSSRGRDGKREDEDLARLAVSGDLGRLEERKSGETFCLTDWGDAAGSGQARASRGFLGGNKKKRRGSRYLLAGGEVGRYLCTTDHCRGVGVLQVHT